ncbi:MAG: hypothetical protein SPL48_02370 [Bacteroidales bacterium]|nr:hypothetical protein [Bacteroidales bacterium]
MKKKLLLTVLILSHFGLTAMSAELHEVTRDNALLSIAQKQGTKIASCNVPEGSSHAILDGARLEQGTYIIYYTIGGTLIDQKKISIR